MAATEREPLAIGERVRDGLGHWYEVVEFTGMGRYGPVRVQALTPCGAALRPIGSPSWVYRGDLRKDGE